MLFFSAATYSQNLAKTFSLGGGIGYHTEFKDDNTGLVLEGVYSFTDDVRLAAGFLYYFVDEPKDVSITLMDLNLNVHYIFKNDEDMRIYALGGINSFRFDVSYKDDDDKSSGDETGINLGAGIEYDVGNVMLFGELKITTGDVHDNKIIIHAGVRYTF